MLSSQTGISLVQINNRSIQDMHIFEDPSRIPIILVERVVNAPLRTTSGSSYFSNLDHRDLSLSIRSGFKPVNKLTGDSVQKNGRILKLVVFVHGFQACSSHRQLLDFILYFIFFGG